MSKKSIETKREILQATLAILRESGADGVTITGSGGGASGTSAGGSWGSSTGVGASAGGAAGSGA